MVVEEVMTEDPVTAPVGSTVEQVVRILQESDVRHIPIVEGEQLVGIISDRDVRDLTNSLMSPDPSQEPNALLGRPISTLMSTDLVVVNPETDLGEVADIMLDQKIGAVPVVAPSSQKLVGIISYVDIIRAARDSL